ncbi:MAG TPA: aspartate-semialdehyde dehydrogenase [Clostridia bacterium]|jgi:aspartate-semialdehyde dehydrogenase|nr:aspartate-semialdehyde dehydrogenase [Clostridia bacterium]
MKKINLAVVGATGMVGNMFLKVLEERQLPVNNYYLYASAKSAGLKIQFMGKEHTVIELNEQNIKDKDIDIALFSAGGSVSKIYAPIFAEQNTIVIDNSSFWRMYDDVPLVVPEVNGEAALTRKMGIVSNPNCSTIQAMLPLKALHDKYTIKRVIFSTYQAVSGAGLAGYNDLKNGTMEKFIYPITNNLIPHIDSFLPTGYTKEEQKMIDETKKILDSNIKVTATTVRVPVFHGHSESINLEFEKPCTLEGIKQALINMPGVVVMDDIEKNIYPMPILAEDKDEVFVGRIRIDNTVDSGCNLWVVADNIRKGAATNTIQIAEYILANDKRFK